MTATYTATFTVWQSRVDAPDFPRDLAWWRGFIPTWVEVTASDDPDAIVVSTTGSKKRGQGLERWLRTCAAGRLADAVEEGAGP